MISMPIWEKKANKLLQLMILSSQYMQTRVRILKSIIAIFNHLQIQTLNYINSFAMESGRNSRWNPEEKK